tara:strand:- start:205 stop:603 length:399 start_codon:yes stop_codon:yes gene_type:complete
MIKKIIEKIFNTQEKIKEEELECAVDEEVVDCEGEAFVQDALNYYTGIPAPAYLPDDEWFGPAPVKSQKQLDYMEQETIVKQEEEKRRQEYSGEPCNMHQLMYEMATSNWNTVAETQGGSENFQGGSENVHR